MAKLTGPEGIPGGASRSSGGIEGPAGRNVKPKFKPQAKSLKEIGLEKLSKIRDGSKDEVNIGYALRHGKITQQEAAAIDPKKFPLPVNIKTIAIIDLKGLK